MIKVGLDSDLGREMDYRSGENMIKSKYLLFTVSTVECLSSEVHQSVH